MQLYRNYPPRRYAVKSVSDEQLLLMWRRGLDTYAIATQCQIPEHEVANRLPNIRAKNRQDVEWNQR